MKFKRLERVELKNYDDFGKIVKLYPKKNKYLVVPEGSDQHWLLKEDELNKIEDEKMAKRKCYFAVHGRLGNEYTALGCNKRKAMSQAKKLQKELLLEHIKIIQM
jgi:hypothetical protein